jgi:hypothetical protein
VWSGRWLSNSKQHASDDGLIQNLCFLWGMFILILNSTSGVEQQVRPNSQQHISDYDPFQNHCYLGLVHLIMNSTSGVELQVILTANNTLVTSYSSTLPCIKGLFFNCELHLRCGAAGDPNSQQHASDDGPLHSFFLFF